MTVIDAIRSRRSTKTFTGRPVTRVQVETLLELAVLAPNHRMTAPWRFLVLGPAARVVYAQVHAARKSAKAENPAAAHAIHDKALAGTMAAPLIVAVVQALSPKPEVREEDYAAIWMAIENMLVGAVEFGLAGQVRTGSIFSDLAVRESWQLTEGERAVGVILMGEPDGAVESKPRVPAAERTVWLP